MSRLQNLGPVGEPLDDIEDAEFVEIDEQHKAQPATATPSRPHNYTVLEWWDDLHVLKKLAAVSALVFAALCTIGILDGSAPTQSAAVATPGTSGDVDVDDLSLVPVDGVQLAPEEPDVDVRPTASPALPIKFDAATELRMGQPYADVREALLTNGYVPAQYDRRDCSPYGTAPGEECFDRPEISYCSGTGPGFCSAYWINGEDALSVTVANGPDGVLHSADAMSRADVISVIAQDGIHLVN